LIVFINNFVKWSTSVDSFLIRFPLRIVNGIVEFECDDVGGRFTIDDDRWSELSNTGDLLLFGLA